MAELFGRAVRVIVASFVIEGLRASFKIRKTLKKEPNEALVSLYNLSPEHRAALETKGIRMVVEAGYVGTVAQIFSGDVRYASSLHDGPDWITKIQSGDGERAYRWSSVEESFAAGTSVADVFSKVAGSTGLDISDAVKTVRETVREQFTQGHVSFGRTPAQLDKLLEKRGLEWSIQDSRLQVLPAGGVSKTAAVLLDASSGLIGSPEYGTEKEKGHKLQILKVKSLLQPSLIPGGTIRVKSAGISGDFRLITVEHTGDTFGGDWYSSCEAMTL